MSSLITIISDTNKTINDIIENGGEMTDEMREELKYLDQSMLQKVDGYAVFIDRIKLEIGYFKEKAKEFSGMAKTLSNLDDSIKERLKYVMTGMEKTEVKGNNYRFKLSDTAGKLEIVESLIPDKYKTQTLIIEIDKEAIKRDLKLGKIIDGASLVKGKSIRKYINKLK